MQDAVTICTLIKINNSIFLVHLGKFEDKLGAENLLIILIKLLELYFKNSHVLEIYIEVIIDEKI